MNQRTRPFHEIVETHGAAVLRVCASVAGPGPDAEDAWSETFLAALRAYPLDGVNTEAWLVTVARRKAIDVVRTRRRVTPRAPDELSALAEERESVPAGDAADEVWADVEALTERQRFVIVHRFVAQWSYPEIAEKLGCSPAAARRCGSDAVKALRHMRRARAVAEEHQHNTVRRRP